MMVLGFRKVFLLSWVALSMAVIPARAQENLDAGKSAAQLFASDCAICHKSARGLSKAGGLFGLSGFLREHYTASRETAGALAAYLKTVDAEAPPARQRPVQRARTSKPKAHDDTKKVEENKKPGDVKSADKAAGEKKDETASEKVKAADTKPGEDKPSESHSANAKPAEKPAAEKKPESAESNAGAESDKAASAKASADKPAEKKE